jgi:hypothetical protein
MWVQGAGRLRPGEKRKSKSPKVFSNIEKIVTPFRRPGLLFLWASYDRWVHVWGVRSTTFGKMLFFKKTRSFVIYSIDTWSWPSIPCMGPWVCQAERTTWCGAGSGRSDVRPLPRTRHGPRTRDQTQRAPAARWAPAVPTTTTRLADPIRNGCPNSSWAAAHSIKAPDYCRLSPPAEIAWFAISPSPWSDSDCESIIRAGAPVFLCGDEWMCCTAAAPDSNHSIGYCQKKKKSFYWAKVSGIWRVLRPIQQVG